VTASQSTKSFMVWPEWPFTHWNATSLRSATSVISGSHRSWLATGFSPR
jgi:hypothetical protein